MVALVDIVLPRVLVPPDPDSVCLEGVVVDLDLFARLDALGPAQDDVTRVVGEDAEELRGGGCGGAAAGGRQEEKGERGFHGD